jgi:hypothetical protein
MPDVSFTELAGPRVVLGRFRPRDVAEFVAYRSPVSGPRLCHRGGARAGGLPVRPRQAPDHGLLDARNAASVAVLERLAMRREGHLRRSTWAKGEWTDDLLYALLHNEFRP